MGQFDRPERRADGESGTQPTIPRRALPPDSRDQTSVVDAGDEAYPLYPGAPIGPNDDEQKRPNGDTPPRLLGGRYELDEVIGRGGMAEVRRAHDTRLGRLVAVKELRADLATDPTFLARFRREAQSSAGLNHPNIVAVYDTGESVDDTTGLAIPFIVMELVQGQTLRDILKDGRRIQPERALELARGVLDALSYSHRSGIIHRDIKPANVMLTPQGTVKVMDFGIARAISDTSTSMTQTAAVIGTAQYLSPEQARGESVDARSDIYSAGCLLYELLLGRPPFIGDSPVSVAYQHVRELPVAPSQLDPAIDTDIDAILLTALAKDPHDRYQSARAMADDIDRLLAGERVRAMTPATAAAATSPTQVAAAVVTTATQEPVEQRKRRFPVVLAVLGSLLVLLLAAGLWWFYQPREPQLPPQVAVPSVLGQTRSAAETEIRTARLVPEVTEVEGANDATIGTVTTQNPIAGAMLDPGLTVQLEVNVGPRRASIPTGMEGGSLSEARRQLNDAGFSNIRTQQATTEPPEARKDTVLDVQPSEGQTLPVSTQIVLEVATGVSPVPNWTGWNQASVEQDRESRGFTNVVFETRETDDPGQAGTVMGTDPGVGSRIERIDRITVFIGLARPAPSPTPEPSPTETATPTATPTPGTATPLSPTATPE